MCEKQKHYPWWSFWRIVYIPAITHSILLAILTIGTIVMVPDGRGQIEWELLSLPDAVAVYFAQPESSYPLILVAAILASVGFVRARENGRTNRVLTIYAVVQLTIGVLLTGSILYLMSRGYIKTQSISERAWYIRDLVITSIFYACISAPLFFLALRGVWVLTVGVPSRIDASGRYVNCTSCNYDLRGTPGPTCPECGASVMAEPTTTSTAAD